MNRTEFISDMILDDMLKHSPTFVTQWVPTQSDLLPSKITRKVDYSKNLIPNNTPPFG